MKLKKRLILIVVILLVILSLINSITMITLTGRAITASGTSSFCMNHPPSITAPGTQLADHNFWFNRTINASDADNQSLVYSDNSDLFEINNLTGLISFTPNFSQIGAYNITLTVQDYLSICPVKVNFSFNLIVYNLAPVPSTTNFLLNQSWDTDVWLTGIDLNDYYSDLENDTLYYSVIHGANVEVSINSTGGVVIYPDPGWNGASWAIFTINDTLNATISSNITLTVGDTTPPQVVILQPQETEYLQKLQVPLKVTVSETANLSYNLDLLGNTTFFSLGTGGTKNLTLSGFGRHSLIIYSVDRHSNYNTTYLNFSAILDTDADGTPDVNETDSDNDGIANSDDFVNGNINSIVTNIPGLNLTLNHSANLSRVLSGGIIVNFTNNTNSFVEFDYNLNSSHQLNLAEIIIEKESSTASYGSLLVRGINLSSGGTKTIYIDKINNSGKVCLKDAAINAITEISSDCNGTNETIVSCPGTTGGYTCTDLDHQYRITGLVNSGAMEMQVTVTPPPPSGSTSSSTSSGGGGGSGGSWKVIEKVVQEVEKPVCKPQRECNEWSPRNCTGTKKQERTCFKIFEDCTVINQKEERDCSCIPQWMCTIWSPGNCTGSQIQQRACMDLNHCSGEPSIPLTQKCGATAGGETGKAATGAALAGKAMFQNLQDTLSDYRLYLSIFIFLLLVMIFSLLLKKRIWQSRKEKRAQETELKPQEKAQLLQARAEILRKIERLRQQSKAKSSGKETKAAAPTLNQELLEIEQKLNRL